MVKQQPGRDWFHKRVVGTRLGRGGEDKDVSKGRITDPKARKLKGRIDQRKIYSSLWSGKEKGEMMYQDCRDAP